MLNCLLPPSSLLVVSREWSWPVPKAIKTWTNLMIICFHYEVIYQRIHISFETKYVRNEVSTEHMFRTTFTFRIARYSFRTKAIHTSFDTKFVSAQFALKFVNAQCVYVNLAGCADWQTGNSDPALLILLTFNTTSRIKTNTNSNTEKARLRTK